jgi:hypothetical protein
MEARVLYLLDPATSQQGELCPWGKEWLQREEMAMSYILGLLLQRDQNSPHGGTIVPTLEF